MTCGQHRGTCKKGSPRLAGIAPRECRAHRPASESPRLGGLRVRWRIAELSASFRRVPFLHRDSGRRRGFHASIRKLRAGIREHCDSTGHDLCWHQPPLRNLLPEAVAVDIAAPEWPQFMRGCVRYRQSLDEQVPKAERQAIEFEEGAEQGRSNPVV